nr:MAG TPA: hypothetical protein [Caudoviricetes sp.]
MTKCLIPFNMFYIETKKKFSEINQIILKNLLTNTKK